MFGILGGMGPLSGVDFMRRILLHTPASTDNEHIPLVLYSAPDLPDRSAAITRGAPSPLAGLVAGIEALRLVGASEVAIACNTAHHWHGQLAKAAGVRVLHVVDGVQSCLSARGLQAATLGLLATPGVIESGFYQRHLTARGRELVLPGTNDLDEALWPAIRAVKAGQLGAAEAPLALAMSRLFDRGADVIILGCSELGLIARQVADDRIVDSMDAFAAFCVDRWSTRRHASSELGSAAPGGEGRGLG